MSQTAYTYFVLCIHKGDEDDLELRKDYAVLPAADNETGFLRVVDESGEDYLYPTGHFARLDLPPTVTNTLLAD